MCVSTGDHTRQDVNRHPATQELLSRSKKTGGGGMEGGRMRGNKRRQMSVERIGETSETQRHMSKTARACRDGRERTE